MPSSQCDPSHVYARPVHCIILPIDFGSSEWHLPTADGAIIYSAVSKTLECNTKFETFSCPRLPLLSTYLRSKQPCLGSVDTKLCCPSLYLYGISASEFTKAHSHFGFLKLMDVVCLACDISAIQSPQASGDSFRKEVLQHVGQRLVPLLLAASVRRIILCVGEDVAIGKEFMTQASAMAAGNGWSMCEWDVVTPNDAVYPLSAAVVGTDSVAAPPPVKKVCVRKINDPCTAAEIRIASAVHAALNELILIPLQTTMPPLCAPISAGSGRGSRAVILRRFDNLAVVVCQVVDGNIAIGDALTAVADPYVTSTGNRIISMRSFPENELIDTAYVGMQVGIMTEAQAQYANKNTSKAVLAVAPFLSLSIGEVLVSVPEGSADRVFSPIMPLQLTGLTTLSVGTHASVTVFGQGGSAPALVSNARSDAGGAISAVLDAQWARGFVVDRLDLDAETSQCQHPLLKTFSTRVAALEVNGSCWCVEWTHVQLQFELHKCILSALEASTRSDTVEMNRMLHKIKARLLSVATRQEENCGGQVEGDVARARRWQIDEITAEAPLSFLLSGMMLGDASNELRRLLHDAGDSHDVLTLATLLPDGGGLWEVLTKWLTDHLSENGELTSWCHREYVPRSDKPRHDGKSRAVAVWSMFDSAKSFLAVLARSARTALWLKKVAHVADGLVSILSAKNSSANVSNFNALDLLYKEWAALGVRNGCAMLLAACGRGQRRSTASRPVVSSPNYSVDFRVQIVRSVLAANVPAATLFAALAVLNIPSPIAARSSSLMEYSTERKLHCENKLCLCSLLNDAAVSSSSKRALRRWLRSAGVYLGDGEKVVSGSTYFRLLERMTFVELEALYVYHCALYKSSLSNCSHMLLFQSALLIAEYL